MDQRIRVLIALDLLLDLVAGLVHFRFTSRYVEHGIGMDCRCAGNRTSRLRFWAVAAK